jgi:hypothetical protein
MQNTNDDGFEREPDNRFNWMHQESPKAWWKRRGSELMKVIENISPLAASVEVLEREHKDHHGHAVKEVNFRMPDTDFTVGTKLKNGKLILLHIGSPSGRYMRKGYGFAVMQRAIKYAADHGLRFFVNDFVPKQTWPLLLKLQRSGYSFRQADNIPYDMGYSAPSVEFGVGPKSYGPFDLDWF